jgi:hypothetical protein
MAKLSKKSHSVALAISSMRSSQICRIYVQGGDKTSHWSAGVVLSVAA